MDRRRIKLLFLCLLGVIYLTRAEIDCGTSFTMSNGYAMYDGRKTTVNNTVPLACMPGYSLHGDTHMTCLQNGSWHHISHCELVDCGTNYPFDNGYVNFTGKATTYDNIVPVSCDDFYQLHGDRYIRCTADGNWTQGSSCQLTDCKPLFHLEHGIVDFDGKNTTYGSTIPVRCDEGYDLQGQNYIHCGKDGSWMGSVVCRPTVCGTMYTLENGYASFGGMAVTFGANVPIRCVDGYEIDGPDHITCQANKTWTTSACKIKDCGRYYQVENGHAHFHGYNTTYGEKVPIQCDVGYYIEGDEYITCLSDGNWSTNSACHIQDCGHDHPVDNGYAHFYGYNTTYGEKVPIHCNVGYYIEGDGYITCLSDGSWSDNSTCAIHDCGRVYPVYNGHTNFHGYNTTYGKKVPIHCNVGYYIDGDEYITCLSNGSWSDNSTCAIHDCGHDYPVDNGDALFYGYNTTYGEKVPIHCNVGYYIEGDEYITCLSNGSWSDTSTCAIHDCGRHYPVDSGHAHFHGYNTTYGEKVPIQCNAGYYIEGDEYITCLSSGSWSDNSTCTIHDCSHDYPVDNGHAYFHGYNTTYGEKVPIHCNIGFYIEGDEYITCLSNGSWSDNSTCAIHDCGHDYPVESGQAHFHGYNTTYGEKVPIHCNDGYYIEGDEYITCLSNGSWSDNSTCAIHDCGHDHPVDNGHALFHGYNTTYGEKVPIHCNVGYYIEGDEYITCLSNGSWSDNSTCAVHDCGHAYQVDNGHALFHGYNTTYGEKVPIHCNIGYYIEGDEYITCLSNGRWSDNSTCSIHDCGRDYPVDNGHAHFHGYNTTYGEKVPIHCNVGYYIDGDNYITCLYNGNWTDNSTCAIHDCGLDYPVDNGHAYFHGYNTTYGEKVPIHCNIGYYIEGDEYITCLSNSSWSDNSTCTLHDCGRDYPMDNGHAHFLGYNTTYGEKVPINCNVGHYIEGDEYITCLSNGSWSDNSTCTILDCGRDYPVNNGHALFHGYNTTYGEKVPIHCNVGYYINGVEYITCLSDGSWSDNGTCDIHDCGSDYSVDNGHAYFQGYNTTYGEQVPIHCNDGYYKEGDEYITCLSNGSWSDNSTCALHDCGSVFTLDHGYVDFTGRRTTYGETVPVSCNTGYGIHGTGHIMCQTDGTWGGNGECLIKDCGVTHTINHGSVNFTGHETTYNMEILVTCNEGYEIEGDSKIKCLATGEWSENTSCRAKPAAVEDDNTGVIVIATVGGVAAVALVSALVLAILQKKGLMCFTKGYTLGPEAVNSTPVPPNTLY